MPILPRTAWSANVSTSHCGEYAEPCVSYVSRSDIRAITGATMEAEILVFLLCVEISLGATEATSQHAPLPAARAAGHFNSPRNIGGETGSC